MRRLGQLQETAGYGHVIKHGSDLAPLWKIVYIYSATTYLDIAVTEAGLSCICVDKQVLYVRLLAPDFGVPRSHC